jgi:hypothetical protein
MSTNKYKARKYKSKRILTANRHEDIIESFHNILFMIGLSLGYFGKSFFGFDSPGFRFLNRFVNGNLGSRYFLGTFSLASLRALEVV